MEVCTGLVLPRENLPQAPLQPLVVPATPGLADVSPHLCLRLRTALSRACVCPTSPFPKNSGHVRLGRTYPSVTSS